jgi:F-type H+-transporting ATPase subunit delta
LPTTSTTARRYAEAIFEIAERDGTVDVWLSQLDQVSAVARDENAVRGLENPSAPIAERMALMHSVVGKSMLVPLDNLIAMVLRRRRLELLPGIAREYRRLYNRSVGIVEATATSAAPLAADELRALQERLQNMTNKRVELTTQVDPSLLGGIQVRIGDMLLDGSVRGRLERLRGRIASGTFSV